MFNHWANYKSLTTAVVYNTPIAEHSRIYLEFGTRLIFPHHKFSTHTRIAGITSTSGFEFFLSRGARVNASFYLGAGIGLINARAEKLEFAPRYANGFIYNNGFRFYF